MSLQSKLNELHFVHYKGNSIHGAKREFMATPIHDDVVVKSLKLKGSVFYENYRHNYFTKAKLIL